MVDVLGTTAELKIAEHHTWKAENIYLISVNINKALDLKASDSDDKSQVFVKVQCIDTEFSTKTVENDQNPIWNESTQLKFYHEPHQLIFSVIDNQNDTDPIGKYTLNLQGLFDENLAGNSHCPTQTP